MTFEQDPTFNDGFPLFVVCECCGRYVGVWGAMGDWIRTCTVCVSSAVLVPRESLVATLERIRSGPVCQHQVPQELQ